MKIELDLTESQWCELANAVASKATLVERGDYGDADPEDGFDPDAWAAELNGIYNIVSRVLCEKGVSH